MNQLDKFKNFIEDRNENVKVGLVGAGQMGQGIVAQVSKMYGVDLYALLIEIKNNLISLMIGIKNTKKTRFCVLTALQL